MDFFRKAADAVGGLILDSDSESDDERGTTTRRAGSSSNTSSKAKTTTHDDHWTDGDVARAASPNAGPDGSFDDSDDEGDEKLIPDAVWGAFAAARGKISEVASTVKRDVASAVEVVKHDLSEFNDRAVDETAAFAGDVAAAEYSTGLGLDDDETDSDGGGARLDADVVDAFDNAVDALDDVGHKVEEFGVKMLGASKRFFHNLKEELTAEDDGSDGDLDGDGDGDTRGFTSRVGLGAGAAVAGGGLAARFASDRAAKSKNQSPNDNQNQNQNQKAPATRPPSLEQRVAAMQRDSATYCDEPEDLAGFERWTSGFDVDSPTVSAEIECVLEGNAFMAELQARIVPLVVTREEFWQRYFYALRRIKLEFGVEKEEEDKEAAAESGGDERKAEEEPEPEPEVEVESEVEVEVEVEPEAEPEPVAEATPASEPPAHPRVAAIPAADSAKESGVTSDGSWAKVTSDGEVVEKTETKKPAVTSEGEGTVVAASPPDADLQAPAGDDDIDEDWGMDSD